MKENTYIHELEKAKNEKEQAIKGMEQATKGMEQEKRENLLREMLSEFNEGRSKTYFCIASTVCEIKDLKRILNEAKEQSKGLDIKKKSNILHDLLSQLAEKQNLILKLRK